MSRDNSIEIDSVHKSFIIQHDAAGSIKAALLNRLRRNPREVKEVLKGVSFRVQPGETVAVVGRNGSGKSTLLSLIARVYRPTSGRIIRQGRVAPLLELGAGFHPDLTGVENLELYGVILGMTRSQLQERFDAIANFAFDTPDLLEKIDTRLRNYSDGMKMRLGFSVAVHTDPDILLVDEVLAVGDEAFQQKCFAKIEELQRQGVTILFVSHLMHQVRRVAHRVVWLHDGRIRMDGPVDEVVEAYVNAANHPDFSPTPLAPAAEPEPLKKAGS